MPSQTTIIRGVVKLTPAYSPVSDVKVEIWDFNGPQGWISGSSTDKAGNFSCIINDPISSQIASGAITLKYIAKKNGIELASAQITDASAQVQVVIASTDYDKLVPDVELPVVTLDYIYVSGTVKDVNNSLFSNAAVNIYENGFRSKKIIASGNTDTSGRYSIKLNTRFFGSDKNINSSIRVEVEVSGAVAGFSHDIFDWNKNITVDLLLNAANGTPEFDRHVSLIKDIIDTVSVQDVSSDTSNNEVKYIAGAVGVSEHLVSTLVEAHQHAQTTGLPADIIYAMMKETGASGNPLLALKESQIKEIIVNAVMNNTIQTYQEDPSNPTSPSNISNIINAAKTFQVNTTKGNKFPNEGFSVNDLLLAIFEGAGSPAATLQQAVDNFLQVFNEEHGNLDEFWQRYIDSNNGDDHMATAIKNSLRIASIAGYQPLITKQIISMLAGKHISTLSTWDTGVWFQMIVQVCTIAPAELRVPAGIRGKETAPNSQDVQQIYARRMATISQAMYPLASILAYLNEPNGNTLITDDTQRGVVSQFLANNPEFDARTTSVYDINSNDQNLTGIDDLGMLQDGLVGIGRLLRVVGGNPFAVIALLQNGVTSARDLALMSWEDFSSNYSYLFSPQDSQQPLPAGPCAFQDVAGIVPDAKEVYGRAVSISNGILSSLGGSISENTGAYPDDTGTVSQMQQVVNSTLPITGSGIMFPHASSGGTFAEPHTPVSRTASSANFYSVMKGSFLTATTTTPTISGDPTLASLFGRLDYALCCDCMSIYSPAAYLVDTLHFLKSADTTTNNAYSVLMNKRPDIKNIDLSCDNTDTPVPYIDLVNELLEIKVMGMASISTPSTSFTFATQNQVSLATVRSFVATPMVSPVASLQVAQAASNLSVVARAQQSVAISNRNVAQSVRPVQNNNVRATVNQVSVSNSATQSVSSAPNVSAAQNLSVAQNVQLNNAPFVLQPGASQAAYPERTYKDSTGVYKNFTAYAVSSVNSYDAIYNKLATAVYPVKLPFNMAMTEARVYLDQCGTSRLELMKLFMPANQATYSTTPPTNSLTSFSLYAEFFNMTQNAATIVAGTHANYASQVYTFYGANSASAPQYPDPTSPGNNFTISSGTGNAWEDSMSGRLDILLQQTQITYSELMQCLTTDYLNQFITSSGTTYRPVVVKNYVSGAATPNDTARMDQLSLIFFTSPTASSGTSNSVSVAFYKKLQAFVRLYRTGITSIYHFDIILRSILINGSSTSIGDAGFKQLGRIMMMSHDLGIAPEILAMWWNNVDTKTYLNYPNNSATPLSTIYQDIFSSNTVANNANSNPFNDPTSLPSSYTAYTGQLANICGIRESDLSLLISYLSLSGSVTLAGLSRLYVLSQLALTWSYSIADFINLLQLSGAVVSTANVSSSSSVDTYLDNLQAVKDTVDAIKISKFQLPEINYLVADVTVDNATAPPPSQIQVFLESIRKELRSNPVFPGRVSTSASANDIDVNNKQFNKLANIIYQHFSKEFGVTALEANLILDVTNTTTNTDGIIKEFLDGNFVQSSFNLSESNVTYIDALTAGTTISGSVTDGNNGNIVPAVNMMDFYNCYRYFHKVAFIYQRLGLRANEFSYLYNISLSTTLTNALGFNFTSLPNYLSSSVMKTIAGTTVNTSGTSGITTNGLFNALLRLSRIMDLVNMLSLPDTALGAMLDAHSGITRSSTAITQIASPSVTQTNAALTSLFNVIKQDNWDTKLDEILGNNVTSTTSNITKYGTTSAPDSLLEAKFGINANSSDIKPDNYKSISRVIDAVRIVARSLQIGLQPTALKQLLTEDISNTTSRNLIVAAKSKYDAKGWDDVAKPLRDKIRVWQRDALVAYTRETTSQLFGELLIDVEMDTCMMTSRIKQAISSVQLFVDRVIMGLEKIGTTTPVIVKMPQSTQTQWQSWRKWYRIWEANRKVFFYPEDWMEPELRDDKTPFFKDFEAEINQNALTMYNADAALKNYLAKLDEVARLQPVGMCEQTLDDGTVITHIISRTYGASHTYFHRTVINNVWAAWEKIKLQIAGDHVVPFVWNNKLCLYWLTFTDKAAPFTSTMTSTFPSTTTMPSDGDNTEWFYNDPNEIGADATSTGSTSNPTINYYKQLHVTLNWSEYQGGAWQNMNVGKENIILKLHPMLDRMLYNSSNSTEKDIFKKLMNNGHVSLIDFVKSRLFLYPYVNDGSVKIFDNNDDHGYFSISGDLYLMLLFPTYRGFCGTTHSEYADHIKSFHFSGTTNIMDVPYRAMFHKRVYPASNAYFKNQSCVSIDPGNSINKDSLGGNTSADLFNYDRPPGIYTQYWMDNDNDNDYVNIGKRDPGTYVKSLSSGSAIITPNKSNFRIVPMAGYTGTVTDKSFLFEDSDNVFFATSVTYTTPDLVSYSSGFATASNISKNSEYDFELSPVKDLLKLAPSVTGVVVMGGSSGGTTMTRTTTTTTTTTSFYFKTLYHHHVHVFMRMLNQYGIIGLYRPDLLGFTSSLPVVQAARTSSPDDDTISFSSSYSPSSYVPSTSYPTNRVDFSFDGPYSVYNWELFFHVPMMIAQRLSENLQFFEAQKWYHFIFDPTSLTYLNNVTGTGAQRFWKFYPFFSAVSSTPSTLQDLMTDVRNSVALATLQVGAYSNYPFQPFMLGRLRTVSFMKNTVMKYLDNLIAWGDNLFMRDTLESINEATQIYLLASNLLGTAPTGNVQRATTKPKSYNDLDSLTATAQAIDALGEACVQIEAFIDPSVGATYTGSGSTINFGNMGYFCIPPNDKLLTYWGIVQDRLYKIRHCQNIQGVVQKLPLFDSPIDPGLLVQAAALGVNVNDVLDDVSGVNTPNYRFSYFIQKANEFVGDVKALGGALLSALEKKDAESLSSLRQGQELSLLNAVLQMKQKQIDEAQANYDAIVKSQENTQAKLDHFNSLVSTPISDLENQHLQAMIASRDLQDQMTALQEIGHMLAMIPQFHVQGIGGFGPSFGGQQLSTAVNMITTQISGEITSLGMDGNLFSTKGGFDRRLEDWQFQVKSAQLEIDQLEIQKQAASIRIKIAENDYQNQQLQIDNASKISDYMQFKYTNEDLYHWMADQISITYYRVFQIAYSLAKKALMCYKREILDSTMATKPLIQPIYWDSRRKGLLAGELLQLDLRNMESYYQEENKRVFELTKHISLAQLAPDQLTKLRANGYCSFNIPEEWFDLDFPGHINRTIKTVSLSIPCVAGPYTTIPCTLSLGSSARRAGSSASYAMDTSVATPACSAIATSTAQNDNGMFDFNFKDERYLPFEGAGAISAWTLSLFNATSSSSGKPAYATFDLDTISDVIIHMKYTAQSSNDPTGHDVDRKNAVNTYMGIDSNNASSTTAIAGITNYAPMARIFSLRHEFPNEWYAYASGIAGGDTSATLAFQLNINHFPNLCSNKTVTIVGIKMISRLTDPTSGYTFAIQDTGNHLGLPSSGAGSTINNTSLTDIKDTTSTLTSDLATRSLTISRSTTRTLTWGFPADSSTSNIGISLEELYMVVIYKLS